MEKLLADSSAPVREKKLSLNLPYFDEDDELAVVQPVRDGWVVGDGPKCREFEEAFADYLGVKHALLTTSGTAALDLAFMALGIEGGGEVIIPDFTFTSTGLAPILNGLQVRLCDVEYKTANIDPQAIERLITKKTKAVVPVDYAGQPCRIDQVMAIAHRHGLMVVHDSAQSCGSRFQGTLVGSQAPVTCFSFHATKNLVTGEGGCLVTNDDRIAERAYIMREKGTNKRAMVSSGSIGYFEYQSKGNSYVQSNILGSLALSQLKKLDRMNDKRREHAQYLNRGLEGIEEIEIPYIYNDVETNWSIYAIRIINGKLIEVRDALRKEGIECNTHYHPLHINSYYKEMLDCHDEDFPNANRVYKTLLRLPMYPQLTREDLDDIVTAVRKIMNVLNG